MLTTKSILKQESRRSTNVIASEARQSRRYMNEIASCLAMTGYTV